MGKVVFAGVGFALVLFLDTWLSIRAMTPSAMAGSRFNPLSIATGVEGSIISHYDNYLFEPR